jgi:hypothetical protein
MLFHPFDDQKINSCFKNLVETTGALLKKAKAFIGKNIK